MEHKTMKYFILRVDKMFSDGPQMKPITLDKKLICKDEFHRIEKRQIVSMKVAEDTLFPDLMDRPAILISEMMMSVIQMYGDVILKRDIILIDSAVRVVKRYFLVVLEKLEVSSWKVEAGEIPLIHLIKVGGPLKNRNIFEIEWDEKRELIINLDFAESILRRGAFGIRLEEIELYEVEKAEE